MADVVAMSIRYLLGNKSPSFSRRRMSASTSRLSGTVHPSRGVRDARHHLLVPRPGGGIQDAEQFPAPWQRARANKWAALRAAKLSLHRQL